MILFSAACVKTLLNAPFGTIGTTPAPLMKLVLASTSAYRRELLQRFGLPFDVAHPDLDESPQPDEAPWATAERLAVEKARAVAGQFKDALIIGSDQVAYMDNDRFGKPGTVERAIAQLKSMSGRTVIFHTALAVLNTRSGHVQVDAVPTEVRFRTLDAEEIRRYVATGEPMDKAGAYGIQGRAGMFVAEIRGSQSGIVGLPLCETALLLRRFAYPI